jgi:hypothetical protein
MHRVTVLITRRECIREMATSENYAEKCKKYEVQERWRLHE